MNSDEHILYKYSDDLYFTVKVSKNQNGKRIVKFVCPKHKCLLIKNRYQYVGRFRTALEYPLCERDSGYKAYTIDYDVGILEEKALALLDQRELSKAKLIRLDDFYVSELKKKESLKGKDSDYFIETEIKTDVVGDTIVVLYVGKKGDKGKTQFFVKPEKLQLSHDFKDQDPSKVLAKIELTLPDRTISQEYDKGNN